MMMSNLYKQIKYYLNAEQHISNTFIYSLSLKNGIKICRAYTGLTVGRSVQHQGINFLDLYPSFLLNLTILVQGSYFLYDRDFTEARSNFKSHMQKLATMHLPLKFKNLSKLKKLRLNLGNPKMFPFYLCELQFLHSESLSGAFQLAIEHFWEVGIIIKRRHHRKKCQGKNMLEIS